MDRRNLLHRLYRTKMALFATIGISAGIVLMVVAQDGFPLKDLGSALFGAGAVAIVFEYFGTRDAEERDRQRLREIIQEQATMIRNSVIDGFDVDHTTMARVASADTLDRVVENSLSARLGDPQLASDVYTDLRDQVLRVDERHYDTHVSINLTPWTDGPASGEGSMFVATMRWEYRITTPPGIRRFACVSDAGEYNTLLRDPTMTGVWQFEPTAELDARSPEVFHLDQYTINGVPQDIDRAHRDGGRLFTIANTDTDADGGEWIISYTYRACTPQHGHQLYLNLNRPSKGLRVDFTYDDSCGIHHATARDFLTGAHQPRVHHSPRTIPVSTITISHDGWIFPKAGLTFTWILTRELHQPAL